MTIPLSKLVNIFNLWEEPPFDRKVYESIKKHGDSIERGELEGADPEVVRRLREMCWAGIARVFLESQLKAIDKTLSRGDVDVAMVRDMGDATLSVAASILETLEVEVTRDTFWELMHEVGKRTDDPRLEWIKKKYG